MKKNQVAVVEPEKIAVELTEVIEQSKMEMTKAQSHAVKFAPFMAKVNELSIPLQSMDKENPTPEMALLARKQRLLMVPNRTAAERVKDEAKSQLLIEGRLIDGLFKVVNSASELTESEYLAIEKHIERKEAEAKAKLKQDRIAELEPFNVPGVEYMQLDLMSNEQYSQLLAGSKLAYETKLAAEKKAEEDRIAAEKLAAEQEAERKRLEAIENERIRVENERLQKEAQEREKAIAEERAKQEAEARKAAEFAEKLRKENEAKLTAERKERERAEAELKAKQEAEQAERDRKAKAEKDALLAPDKEKVNQLYTAIKSIAIPEFMTTEGKQFAANIQAKIGELLKGVKEEAAKLK